MAKKFGLSPKEIITFVQQIQELDIMERVGKSQNTKVLFFPTGKKDSFLNDMIVSNEAKVEE